MGLLVLIGGQAYFPSASLHTALHDYKSIIWIRYEKYSPMLSINFYAELLLNIRQVTVFAKLPSNCNGKTRVWLCHDQRTLRLSHEDEEATIELPCPVAKNVELKIPPATTRELSFRLVVSDTARLPAQAKEVLDHNDPWPALKLKSETRVACGSCGSILVNSVNAWKHLPNSGWADMMDFWHCHKPNAKNGDNEYAGSDKGYAAANALGPTAGIGLVDAGKLHVAAIDCTGLEVGQISPSSTAIEFKIPRKGNKKEACIRKFGPMARSPIHLP